MSTDIKAVVEGVIKEVAQMNDVNLTALKGNLELVDELGFTSLMVLSLIHI